ncbi:poly-gamma-glutamate biosynthesis protein [Streptomyces sp. Act143]|uniref:CapA family protein n=1 Tax=Streptomyces sp. Act143 TaxID=2200760 RepID=UPI000D68359B|nr:CapA family protein [Streptomyces sp. Act143]PWI14964.1 poly-gamma-glutamate biosynthesis protein [Streptomyces sp. Act143]
MAVTIALAGDAMLGRGVGEVLAHRSPRPLFSHAVQKAVGASDLFLLNLECCISDRDTPPVDLPGKAFFFRAPSRAARVLADLGVDAVSVANNHAFDHGPGGYLDTRVHLARAGIRAVGAGATAAEARRPLVLEAGGLRVGIIAVTDHPAEFAATDSRPGVAYADLWNESVPAWLTDAIGRLARTTDIVLVSVHWGPNMTARPVPHVRRAAPALTAAGATLVVGHSAHVFHGFTRRVLYDLGDFIDDYAVHPALRNDLGLLWLVTLDERGPLRTEAVPIALDYCHTRLADRAEYAWIADRLIRACAEMGTVITDEGDRLTADRPRSLARAR